jgi:hypothetical protein
MKIITVKGNEYKLEFGFDAAEHKSTVQKMFKVKSGAYMVEEGISVDGTPTASGIINGTASMVGDIPGIVKSAFFAGLLEHHDMPEEDAHELLKDYMRENKLSFRDVLMELTECMETDGFFELAGITAMLKDAEPEEEKKTIKAVKTPQDHKKPTSTK